MSRLASAWVGAACLAALTTTPGHAQDGPAADAKVRFVAQFAESTGDQEGASSLEVTFFDDRPEADQVEQVLGHCLTAASALHPASDIIARAWYRESADRPDRESLVLPDGSDSLTFAADDQRARAAGGTDRRRPSGEGQGAPGEALLSVAADEAVVDACKSFSSQQVAALVSAGAEQRGGERKDIVAAMRDWSEKNDLAVTRDLRLCMSAISKAIVAAGSAAPALPEDLPAAIARGSDVYKIGECAKCHEGNGRGGEKGPDLTDGEWSHCDGSIQGIRAVLVSGVPANKLKDRNRPFPMNPATNLIPDDEQITDLAIYVHSLSQR